MLARAAALLAGRARGEALQQVRVLHPSALSPCSVISPAPAAGPTTRSSCPHNPSSPLTTACHRPGPLQRRPRSRSSWCAHDAASIPLSEAALPQLVSSHPELLCSRCRAWGACSGRAAQRRTASGSARARRRGARLQQRRKALAQPPHADLAQPRRRRCPLLTHTPNHPYLVSSPQQRNI